MYVCVYIVSDDHYLIVSMATEFFTWTLELAPFNNFLPLPVSPLAGMQIMHHIITVGNKSVRTEHAGNCYVGDSHA